MLVANEPMEWWINDCKYMEIIFFDLTVNHTWHTNDIRIHTSACNYIRVTYKYLRIHTDLLIFTSNCMKGNFRERGHPVISVKHINIITVEIAKPCPLRHTPSTATPKMFNPLMCESAIWHKLPLHAQYLLFFWNSHNKKVIKRSAHWRYKIIAPSNIRLGLPPPQLWNFLSLYPW